jgi:hypothetical protein
MTRLSTAALIGVLTLGLASPAAATCHQRPFSGWARGGASFPTVSTTVCPPTDLFAGGRQTRSSASGKATVLGPVRMTSEHCTPKTDTIRGGVMVFTTRNGDTVRASYAGTCTVFDPATAVPGKTMIRCDTSVDITGGTGPYRHARGHADLTGLVTYEGLNVASWPGTWTWKGWIRTH